MKKAHQIFGKPADKNPVIKNCFFNVLNGQAGETIPEVRFDPHTNACEVS